jgi:hypothetical protein
VSLGRLFVVRVIPPEEDWLSFWLLYRVRTAPISAAWTQHVSGTMPAACTDGDCPFRNGKDTIKAPNTQIMTANCRLRPHQKQKKPQARATFI